MSEHLTAVRDLFEAVLAQPAEDRETYLAGCGQLDAVTDQVRALLAADDDFESTGGTGSRRSGRPWPGDRVAGYRLIAPIGIGGMGTIWRAESTRTPGLTVAIKFPVIGERNQDEAEARLRQECTILADVSHPGVVPLIDAGETEDGVPYVVMSELTGVDFAAHCAQAKPDAVEFARLVQLVSLAVGAVHSAGIVHRDIKPQNVLVTPDGWPTLIDFGVARITDDSKLTPSYVTVGSTPMTPAYASPEQRSGDDTTPATDVYAIGRLISEALPMIRGGHSRVRARLATIAQAAMSQDANARPANGVDLAEQIEQIIVNSGTPHRGAVFAVIGAIGALTLVLPFGLLSSSGSGLPESIREGFRDVAPDSIPGEPHDLVILAERERSPDLMITAASRAIDRGDVGYAREILARDDVNWLDAGPLATIHLAELHTGMGFFRDAFETVDAISIGDFEDDDAARAQALGLSLAHRLGHDLETEAFQELQDVAAENEWHDIEVSVATYRLRFGDPERIESEARNAASAQLDPADLESDHLFALVELHARLVAWGVATPADDENLEAIENEVIARLDEEPSRFDALRAIATTRTLRIIACAERDAELAGELADDVVNSLVEWSDYERAPIDAFLQVLLARLYVASLRPNDFDATHDTVEDALDLASAIGLDGWEKADLLTDVPGDADHNALDSGAIVEMLRLTFAGSPPEGLERSALIDYASPWWWPAP
ncbi:MAG: serine/threonine-protein kinase [Planctomycetota bacterium]